MIRFRLPQHMTIHFPHNCKVPWWNLYTRDCHNVPLNDTTHHTLQNESHEHSKSLILPDWYITEK